jgi:2-oxoisovalerate dehydrogenase E1 component
MSKHNQQLIRAYELMCLVEAMATTYEANRSVCKYVHGTSRGHEAIQLATAFQLFAYDFVSPYYRDESLLLGLGFTPYELMLQLHAKQEDIFSGGRSYYNHPSYRGPGKPLIIHQSSATPDASGCNSRGHSAWVYARSKLPRGGVFYWRCEYDRGRSE